MKSIRIIIADTSQHFRKALSSILTNISDDLNIAEASSGSQLIDLACSANPQIIFTEVRMKDNDGVDAVRKIRQSVRNVRIYAFSAYENTNYMNLMREAGADGFLVKNNDNYDRLKGILELGIGNPELEIPKNPKSAIPTPNSKFPTPKSQLTIVNQ